MTPEPAQSSRARLALAAQVAVVVLYLATAAVFVHYGDLNQDEGYILQAARRAMQGIMPVRDFFFVQTPLQPYVYGAALAPFGISILGGRIVTTLFALGSLLLAMGLASRLTKSPWGGALAGLLIVLFADMTYHNTISKTHAQTGFLLMLGFSLAMRGGPGRSWRDALALIAVFGATATRLTAAAPGLLLVAWIITRRRWTWPAARSEQSTAMLARGRGGEGPALAACAAILAATIAWVIVVGPDRAWLNLAGYHLPDHPRPAWHVEMPMAEHLALVAGALVNTFRRYLLVLGPPAVVLALRRRRAGRKKGDNAGAPGGEPRAWVLVAAGVLLYLAHAPAGGFGHFYFSMSLPLVAAGATVMLFRLGRQVKPERRRRAIVVAACGLLLAAVVAESVHEMRHRCTFSGETQLAQLQRVAGVIRETVPPGEEFLAFSPYLAVEARRDVPLPMSMAWWCYYPDLPTEQCRDWGVVNGELLVEMLLERRVAAVAITDTMRGEMIGKRGTETFAKVLIIYWDLRWSEAHFGQLQTRLDVWAPRTEGPGGHGTVASIQ